MLSFQLSAGDTIEPVTHLCRVTTRGHTNIDGCSARASLSCSAFLPLHEGLIVSTNGVEVTVILGEHDTDDVLGVTAVTAGLAALSARVAEQVDEAEIVSGSQKHAIAGAANGVDVSTIGASGVDTFSGPLELDSLGCPLDTSCVGSATLVLSPVAILGEEEELVSATVGAEVLGVLAPVKGHDVGVVGLAGTGEGPVASVVDVDVVVVGADGEEAVVRGE